jgi:uncharacterized protein YaaR (DUF327 family)
VLIKWSLNKTENSSSKKKERIKFTGKSGNKNILFEEELNEALYVSKTSQNFDSDFYLENLDTLENNLIANPDQENYKEYKQYIKMISNKLLKNAFKLSTVKDSRKKQYNYIKIIDDNLNQLFNAIMQKTGNREKIVSLIGSIKGIILDLKV